TGQGEVGVSDVAGRHVRTLMSGVQPAGEHTLAWDGRDDAGGRLNAGVYMLRLDAGGHSETRALRLVKESRAAPAQARDPDGAHPAQRPRPPPTAPEAPVAPSAAHP